MVTAYDICIEAPQCVNGSSCLYEVMATASDGDLEYVDGSSRIRGLGCDDDRPSDRPDDLVEAVVPVIHSNGCPAQIKV